MTGLDGTLCDIMSEVLEQVWSALGVALSPEDCCEYDLVRAFLPKVAHKLASEELESCLRMHIWENPGVYRRLRPYWEVHQAYQAWIKAGGGFVVLTARPTLPAVMGATQAWLEAWSYGGAGIYWARGYGGKRAAMAEIIRNLDYGAGASPEVWVAEDDPEQAADMADLLHTTSGVVDVIGTVYLMDRPWTRDCYGGLLKRRRLIQDIMDRIATHTEFSSPAPSRLFQGNDQQPG